MCGMFVHGFYWEDNGQNYVMLDKANSHAKIRENNIIPDNAVRIGVNPINGNAESNDNGVLPLGIKEEAEKLFRNYYPDKYAIAEWIRDNHGKENDDKEEWELPLLLLLADNGINLLSKEYYQKRIESYQKGIEDYQKGIEYYQKRIEYYQGIEYYQKWIEYCQKWIEYYQKWMEDYQKWMEDCTGSFSAIEIEAFIPYFLSHPSIYWT